MRTMAMLRHFHAGGRAPRSADRRSAVECLRVLGIVLAAPAGGPAPVGDAARERHVESRDVQELLALVGVAQALRPAPALPRLYSVLVTPFHGEDSGT